jgi:hypothetical protein
MILQQMKDMGYSADWQVGEPTTTTSKVINPAWEEWNRNKNMYYTTDSNLQENGGTGVPITTYNGPPIPEQYINQTTTTPGTGSWNLTDLPGDSPYEIRQKQQDELNTMQLEYAKQQLEWLKDAREMGEITGDLTADELAMFDQMEQNSIQTLTEAVQKGVTDISSKEIASLVSRGVWQGDIGAHAIADIGERASEQIATGTREINTTKNANVLNAMENKRNRQLQEIMSAQGNVGTVWGANQAVNQAGQQMAQQAAQYGAGLQNQWNTAKMNTAMGAATSMQGFRGQMANNALQANIATGQNQANQAGATSGMVGSMAGGAGAAAAAAAYSDERLKDIEGSTTVGLTELEGIDPIVFTWKDSGNKEIGLSAQNVKECIPDAVTEDSHGYLMIKFLPMMAAMVNGINELNNRITALERKS